MVSHAKYMTNKKNKKAKNKTNKKHAKKHTFTLYSLHYTLYYIIIVIYYMSFRKLHMSTAQFVVMAMDIKHKILQM